MEAMEVWFMVFGVMLLMGGYTDIKTRKVSDKLTAGMWCVLSAYCFLNPSFFPFAVLTFSIIYMYNAIAYPINPKFGFGWADILIIPVYGTFIYAFGGNMGLMWGLLIASVLTLAYIYLFRKGAPYVMALAVSYVSVLVILPRL